MTKTSDFRKYWSTPTPSEKHPDCDMWHLNAWIHSDVETAMRIATTEGATEIGLFYHTGRWDGYCYLPK